MSRKKKQTNVDIYASLGIPDTFGRVYDSMWKHPAFQSLPSIVKLFYVACRVQAESRIGKACLYNHALEFGTAYNTTGTYARDFVFPAKHLKQYGFDRSNASRYFNILEEKGFIKRSEMNKYMKKVNVYSFSDEWKNSS